MTTNNDFGPVMRSWFADDIEVLPDRVLDAVLADLPVTRQQRRRTPWRPLARVFAPMAFAAAALVLVVGGLAFLADRQGGIGGPVSPPPPSIAGSPSPEPTPAPSPTPEPSPTVVPGYGSAPPDWATNPPVVPATPLPSPTGSPLPDSLVGRLYNVDPPVESGSQALVLTLRAADDPQCTALYGGASTCFTILWSPNYPRHAQDPGVRGPARIVDGRLVLGFAIVPNDPACEATTSTYAVLKGGDSLVAIDAPACSFGSFVAH